MCDWCIKHGDGKIWYKNALNYARKMYKSRKGSGGSDESHDIIMSNLREYTSHYHDVDWPTVKKKADEFYQAAHFGQVIPLQDAKAILSSIAYPIGKMSCVCLRRHRGMEGVEDKERTHVCIGIGVGMYKWERFPEMYKGNVEFIDEKEACKMLDDVNKKGLVHSIWTFGTPYLGGLCNCEYPICLGIRNRLDYNIGILIKGEYVSEIDPNKCNGCKRCMTRCQFGAIKYSPAMEKCYISGFFCFGCGLCETICPQKAIELILRSKIPGLANVW